MNEALEMNLQLGSSYWLISVGKVWITNMVEVGGKVVLYRCEDVKGKDFGFRRPEEFEGLE